MMLAPESANFLGGKRLLVGNHKESGDRGSSQGPNLIASELPPTGGLANSAALDAIKLIDHGPQIPQCMLDPSLCSFENYRATDIWGGGAWVDTASTSGLMMVGRKALGDTCYGEPGNESATRYTTVPLPNCASEITDKSFTTRADFCGSIGADGIVNGSQGFHSGPHTPMMLFYSPDDLRAVSQGSKLATEVKPVSRTRFNAIDPDGCGTFGAVAYDAERQLIYVTEKMGSGLDYRISGQVVVHVWSVE